MSQRIVVDPAKQKVTVLSAGQPGPRGYSGIVRSDTPPTDTSVLWADTSSPPTVIAPQAQVIYRHVGGTQPIGTTARLIEAGKTGGAAGGVGSASLYRSLFPLGASNTGGQSVGGISPSFTPYLNPAFNVRSDDYGSGPLPEWNLIADLPYPAVITSTMWALIDSPVAGDQVAIQRIRVWVDTYGANESPQGTSLPGDWQGHSGLASTTAFSEVAPVKFVSLHSNTSIFVPTPRVRFSAYLEFRNLDQDYTVRNFEYIVSVTSYADHMDAAELAAIYPTA